MRPGMAQDSRLTPTKRKGPRAPLRGPILTLNQAKEVVTVNSTSPDANRHGELLDRPGFVRAAELDAELRGWLTERAADVALDLNDVATAVGVVDGLAAVCVERCCLGRPGVLVALPDVMAVEAGLNGIELPATVTLRRDGRSVRIYRGGAR
jgi:hypothetical protein